MIFLGFYGHGNALGGSWRKRAMPFSNEVDDASFRQWKRVQGMDVEQQLKRMTGPQALFRGMQKEAITCIMQGHSPVTIVMGTGGGKA